MLCKRLLHLIWFCPISYSSSRYLCTQMSAIDRSQGINDFIQQEEVDAIDLTVVSLILEGLTGSDEIVEDVVCRLIISGCRAP